MRLVLVVPLKMVVDLVLVVAVLVVVAAVVVSFVSDCSSGEAKSRLAVL